MSWHYRWTREKWDTDYSRGCWKHLHDDLTEKSRHAVIGMYCREFFPGGAVLDIGCGQGMLFGFLTEAQQRQYLGIDLSAEAVKLAAAEYPGTFQASDSREFVPGRKYEIIIFGEFLYYVNQQEILEKYYRWLCDDGIIIISLFSRGVFYDLYNRSIWGIAGRKFHTVEKLSLSGRTRKIGINWPARWDLRVMQKK